MIEFIGKDHRLSVEERESYIPEIAPFRIGKHIYLQTCNRVELYRGDGEAPADLARHLFRVVSGLESKMLGEAHIQGQVKRAYAESIKEENISKGLHRLFQVALRCGKRVRTETEISLGAVSHSHAAVVALKKHIKPGQSGKVLIIGVNDLTERIVRFLGHGANHYQITIANRTMNKAVALAEQVGADVLPFDQLEEFSYSFDILISATSSESIVVKSEWFSDKAVPVMIDLALPRDIDPVLGNEDNAFLYNLDHLEEMVTASIQRRSDQVLAAEKIVEEEVEEYLATFQYKKMENS